MNVVAGLRKIFNFLAEKVCFTFAVAFFSVQGAVSAFMGLIYIWATVDRSSAFDVQGAFILCGSLLVLAALSHFFLFGLGRLGGRRWEFKRLRILNDQLEGLSIPVIISTPELAEVTRALERIPSFNTRVAAVHCLSVALCGVVYAAFSGNMQNVLSVLAGGLIACVLYVIFTFLITEMITTEVRRDARWLLAMREEWSWYDYAVSLKVKFAFIIILILISVIITYGIASSPVIHSRLAVILVFTGMITIAGLCLCMLIFNSIRGNLKEIGQTAADLSDSHSAQFLSGSIDKEFIETSSGLYHASLKIIEYRDKLQALNVELEEKVQERTAEIKLLSITDSLTGCFNRGYLTENLVKEIKKARRYAHPLSIVMCDLDHFKLVNDTYGHQAGDQVLREFVACIKGLYRNDLDWLARYGGEEFLIVLPETGCQGAECLAERVRHSIAERSISVGLSDITITASFGVTGMDASTPAEKLDPEAMITQADFNLYQAKQEGRNRVVTRAL